MRGIKQGPKLICPVAALQAARGFAGTCSWTFSPGYHRTGFQPYAGQTAVTTLGVVRPRSCLAIPRTPDVVRYKLRRRGLCDRGASK
jgi:hypothetical protein